MNEAQQKEGLVRKLLHVAHNLRSGFKLQLGETEARICEEAAAALQEPKEGVTVPVEPTEEMVRAGLNAPCYGHPETATASVVDIYKAMLAAHQGREDKE